ncbi:MAG TPA: TA system VapC family ribonuclease toxin [Thermoanaerobaculia bacterium]|nr:TA system VapC family ribonuclease toxin [Thermoanaerobaculia bacterium]
MIAVDTNVLVYAHREEAPEHEAAKDRLRELAEGDLPWALPVFCLGEFLRVTTHPRVFSPPSTLDQALSALDGLLESPMLRVLNPGARYPTWLDRLARQGDARGNLAFDAQIAAVCLENGVRRLLTLDRDFARFPEIEIEPLASR